MGDRGSGIWDPGFSAPDLKSLLRKCGLIRDMLWAERALTTRPIFMLRSDGTHGHYEEIGTTSQLEVETGGQRIKSQFNKKPPTEGAC
jgi:hypothetical protein